MTEQEMRIAIGRACGWKTHDALGNNPDISLWYREGDPYLHALPDYPNDLNAMREAEGVLLNDESMVWKYFPQLRQVAGLNFWRATARQRAESFLRTIGKWKELPEYPFKESQPDGHVTT